MVWLLFACGSALFAGATTILVKIGLKNTDSDLATAVRTTVVLVFAWLLAWISGGLEGIANLDARSLLFLLFSGVATGLSWLCYFRALSIGEASKVAAVDKSSTPLTVLLAICFLGESLTLWKGVGLALMSVGIFLMSVISVQKEGVGEKKSWLIYALLSAVFASLTALFSKIGVGAVNSNLATALRTTVVLVFAWSIAAGRKKLPELLGFTSKTWIFLILSGFATGLSWLCFFKALSMGEAGLVVPIDKLSVLITVLFSVIFLHEKLSTRGWIGLVFLVGGTLVMLL